MTKEDFIIQAEKLIFKDIIAKINKQMGQEGWSFMAMAVMLKLGIKIDAEQFDKEDIKCSSKNMTLDDLAKTFGSYISDEEPAMINFTFAYNKEKHLDIIMELIEQNPAFFAIHYLKHLFHTIKQHNTVAFRSGAMRLVGTKDGAHDIIDIACDYDVMNSIKDIFDKLDNSIEFERLSKFFPYNKNYTSFPSELTELAKDLNDLKVTKLSKHLRKIKIRGQEYIVAKKVLSEPGDKTKYQAPGKSNKEMNKDVQISNLSEMIKNDIGLHSKGTSIGDLFNLQFSAIEPVDVSWFKKFKTSFFNNVMQKVGEGYQTWANISKTKRHYYSAPISISKKKKVNIIISLDHSGSMQTEDLAKILGVIEDRKKHIGTLIVMSHTSAVLRQFTLSNAENITKDPQFKEAMASRHGNGGTSHLCVYDAINKLNLKDPEQWIYLSFSDNYSDVEQTVYNFPVMQKITQYYVRPSNGVDVDTNKVNCTNIVIP